MGKKKDVMWAALEASGLEHLSLTQEEDSIVADGLILGIKNQSPFRIRYYLYCDQEWRIRDVKLTRIDGSSDLFHLCSDGQGHWTVASHANLPALDGCLDIDLSATPFSNTLPIRRLQLNPGESAEIQVAFVAIPEMEVEPVRQRYTCLKKEEGGIAGLYRYEGLSTGYSTILPVDNDGLVIDYDDIFERVLIEK